MVTSTSIIIILSIWKDRRLEFELFFAAGFVLLFIAAGKNNNDSRWKGQSVGFQCLDQHNVQ